MARTTELLGRLESRWTAVRGLSMHARVSVDPVPGDRIPVVLVHGLGVSSRYMIPTARRLAPDYRVYAPDLPGFGRSAKPRQVLNVPEQADALVAWMDAVGLERAAMIGNSMGCQYIVDAAVRYPERVERLVLLGPSVDRYARSAARQLLRVLHDSLHEAFTQPFVLTFDYLQAGLLRAWQTLQHGLADAVEEKLPQVRVPALVIRGEFDPIVPQRWIEDVERLLPHGQLIVLRGAPHTANYSTPRAFVRVVRPFLDEAGGRSAADDGRG